MQERTAQLVGTSKKQAQVISMKVENDMRNRNILGEDTPDKLRSTVLYLIGVNCALRAGDEHKALRRPGGVPLLSSLLRKMTWILGAWCTGRIQ